MSPMVIAYIPGSIKIDQLVHKFEWRDTQKTDIRLLIDEPCTMYELFYYTH